MSEERLDGSGSKCSAVPAGLLNQPLQRLAHPALFRPTHRHAADAGRPAAGARYAGVVDEGPVRVQQPPTGLS